MRSRLHLKLHAIARRESRDAGTAEDVVQDAILAAIVAGRLDFDAPENQRWLVGTVRNTARMTARSAIRRRQRESAWQVHAEPEDTLELGDLKSFLASLPNTLRMVAALTLSGHNRREIAYLLKLSDTALRQRISTLKRHAAAAGLVAPTDLLGLNLDIAYGRLRNALLPKLLRHGGTFASHDPDGHLFLVRRSQITDPRQLVVQTNTEGSQ